MLVSHLINLDSKIKSINQKQSVFSLYSLMDVIFSEPLALCHNFMNIDDPAETFRMSDKSAHFNMA